MSWVGLVAVAAGILIGLGYVAIINAPGRTRLPDTRLTVAATIFPLADITRQVGGAHARVLTVIPPGTSEHSFSLTPPAVAALQASKAIFGIGQGLDNALTERLVAALPAPVITVDRGIALRNLAPGEPDPHYWLTVPNAKIMAETIATELTSLDPTHASDYANNLQAYQATLDRAEAELVALAARAPSRSLFTRHAAWGYFADHYGFTIAATYEPTEGKEPTAADLARLGSTLRQLGVTTFFDEPQKSAAAANQLLRADFGLNIATLDPVGGIPPADSYVNLMRTNMGAVAGVNEPSR